MPVKITINKKYSHESENFYSYKNNIIGLSVNKNAVDYVLRKNGDLNLAINSLEPNVGKRLKQEFTEEKIKGSIHHELVHWIDNNLNNQHIRKAIEKRNKILSTKQKASLKNINTLGFERQSQIHNIRQLYLKHRNKWDELTFVDMLLLSPPLITIYNILSGDDRKKWIMLTKKRMHREGLLGQKMINN
jgi:hypothetical protein